jgi:hypothetical protein
MARHTYRSRKGFAGLILDIQVRRLPSITGR